MAFKNAFKNMIAHFGTVWVVLLFVTVFGAILVGLSLPFLLPIASEFAAAGVFEGISDSVSALFGEGGWNGMLDGLKEVYNAVVGVFSDNDRVVTLTMLFLIFIATVAFRFFFGLYEIPLATVIDGRMSCNAEYSFCGKFISTIGVSVRFSLAKMPLMIAFDGLTFGSIFGIVYATGFNVATPFVVIFILVVFRAFRSSLVACWAPCVASGMGVVRGFCRSCEICFKRFGSIYSTYAVLWLLIIAFVTFLTVFTLGVGLIVALPLSMTLLGNAGTTVMYNKCGKRYYVDGTVFTPPMENIIE